MTPDQAHAILAAWPDLAGRPLTLLGQGWDSLAMTGGGQVFKLPQGAAAAARLRREAAVLAALRGRVRLPIPQMALHDGPPLISTHALLPGEQLLTAGYDALPDPARDRLAADLAGFHADLHGVPVAEMQAAGAGPVEDWGDPMALTAIAAPALGPALAAQVRDIARACAALPPDPLGQVFGHFDAHGWNMAFDPAARRLNGIYDFGDSGIGPLHQEFVYSSFISPDLTRRMIAAYAARTGRAVDPVRVHLLTGLHRLWELSCATTPDDRRQRAQGVAAFLAQGQA